MDKRFMFYGGMLNLATLLLGITLGFLAGTSRLTRVYAQESQTPPIEDVSPNIVTATAAFGTLLAGRAAIDELSIKGLDIAKFDQNVVNLLASKNFVFTSADIQQLISNSHSEKILRMKQPTPPPQPQGKKP